MLLVPQSIFCLLPLSCSPHTRHPRLVRLPTIVIFDNALSALCGFFFLWYISMSMCYICFLGSGVFHFCGMDIIDGEPKQRNVKNRAVAWDSARQRRGHRWLQNECNLIKNKLVVLLLALSGMIQGRLVQASMALLRSIFFLQFLYFSLYIFLRSQNTQHTHGLYIIYSAFTFTPSHHIEWNVIITFIVNR